MFTYTNYKDIPSFEQMMLPHLEALSLLNGKASVKNLDAKTIEIMGLPESITAVPHSTTKRTEVEYRLAWARTYLKKYGLIENASRGIWSITKKFDGDIESLNASEIIRTVRQIDLNNDIAKIDSYEAFEMLVWNTLKDILDIQNKKIEFAPPYGLCDFILPNGLDETDEPIYVEIKISLNLDAVIHSVLRISEHVTNGSILFIFKSDLSTSQIHHLYDKLNSISDMNIEIWDINTLMGKMNPDSDYVEYLINPQKTLIENTIEQSDENIKNEQKKIIDKLKQSYLEGNITLFLGAGVSMSARMPLWNELINQLRIELIKSNMKKNDIEETDVQKLNKLANDNRDTSPLIQMRYIKGAFELEKFYEIIHKTLYHKHINKKSKLINSIIKIALPSMSHKEIKNIVTYNFDNLLEQAFLKENQPYKTIYRENDIPQIDRHNIYHVHGYLPQNLDEIDLKEIELIFSEEDYHKVYRDAYCWSNLTQLNFLRETVCVFIGCSLTDPNLRRLLDVAIRSGEEEKPRHYAFMQRQNIDSLQDKFEIGEKAFNAYKNMDNNLRERYLRNLGLNIIWFDDFDEIPQILMDLLKL